MQSLFVQHVTRADRWMRLPLPPGDNGVHQTVGAMSASVQAAAQHPSIRAQAAALARGMNPSTKFGAVLWTFLRRSMTFRRDPISGEMLQSPVALLGQIRGAGMAWGDCDDRAMLGAALLRAWGAHPVLVTCGLRAKGRFQHVYYGELIDPNGQLDRSNVVPSDPQENVPYGQWTRGERTRIFLV